MVLLNLTCFHSKKFRKSIIFTVIIFLRTRFHLNCLRGPLPCSSSCHRSSGERSCMTCIIEFTITLSNSLFSKFCSEDLKHFVSSWSCIKNLITRPSYPRSKKCSALHQNLSFTVIEDISFYRSIRSSS